MNEDREEMCSWEQQCISQLESEQDLEGQLNIEKGLIQHNIWCSFQTTATAISQLYKDRVQNASSLWVPFQTAAGTVTTLYKDCNEGMKKVSDVSVQCGYQRRNKELLQWVRKKRRHIRREDLLAYLAGKVPPPRSQSHRTSPKPRLQESTVTDPLSVNVEDNLRIFGEALALNSNMARRQRSNELNTFFASEYARNCIKRPASSSPPHDVNMDSPTHKRSRLF